MHSGAEGRHRVSPSVPSRNLLDKQQDELSEGEEEEEEFVPTRKELREEEEEEELGSDHEEEEEGRRGQRTPRSKQKMKSRTPRKTPSRRVSSHPPGPSYHQPGLDFLS